MVRRVSSSMKIHAERKEIVMTRIFDAPRELVFKICTDPELIPQWWGPRRLTTMVDKMEVKPGGQWRYVQQDAEGNEFSFHGEYREITPPERLVSTFEFEGMPGHVLVETTTFEDEAGRTKMTVIDTFESLEDLQGMVQSGMESGATESYERLSELLIEAQKVPRKMRL